MSNFTRLAEVTFWDTVTGQFLYGHLTMIELPTSVETEKGFAKILRLTPKCTAI